MTFDALEKVLYTFIAPSEVDRMTIAQIVNAYSGHFEKEGRRQESLKIVMWEATRWQTWVLFNLQVGKRGRILSPEKMLRFEWDKAPIKISDEQARQIYNKFPDKWQ